ncbi:hypothetical protein Tco_0922024 [Tanacetum coccineum]|uniref:Retrovirus-related Pol polyprotein from transposon TNT 1-94-like beta-barrel domain-containing protein n=1 Tax=Tanacetum coccineum TaxID=301880 RepID=A0ABQ5CWY9_9ASTR
MASQGDGNRRIYKVVLEKDSEASKVKKEKYKSLALKARKVSSDEEESCSKSDKEYAMAMKDFKKLFRRRGKFVHLKVKLELDEWIKDSGCSRHMTGNKALFLTYEAIIGGNVVFNSNTKSKIIRKVMPITSAEDKSQRILEVKARTVEKRFGGNAATKKTQKIS